MNRRGASHDQRALVSATGKGVLSHLEEEMRAHLLPADQPLA
jgi:hypothetical protein